MAPLLVFVLIAPLLLLLTHKLFFSDKKLRSQSPDLPGTYPIVGSLLSLRAHARDHLDWFTTLLKSSPTSTVIVRHPLGAGQHIFTANPANVEHIIKTKFPSYPRGTMSTSTLADLFGKGLSNVDGHEWKFQRQLSSHVFSTKLLRKFVQTVVDKELSSRLIPILEGAARSGQVLDFQGILRRFGFDNICEIAFGYDPKCLLASEPEPESSFADAYDEAAEIIGERLRSLFPPLWRLKRFLNIGSERKLKQHVSLVREFAQSITREKISNLGVSHDDSESNHENLDLLSRYIIAGQNDEQLLTDTVMTFIHAGRDTTSAAMTWFFWLISQHPDVEKKILDDIKSSIHNSIDNDSFEETRREMIYTQAALFESMRLYPPLPLDGKEAAENDTLPDGTFVAAGTTVVYHIYAMGRMESVWGNDWSEFKPERWLVKRDSTGTMEFVSKDPYTYPVFHGGPRFCLGKDMAVLQMKRIVAKVFKRFKVVPAIEDGFKPVYVMQLTAEMEGGFPVMFVERDHFKD